MGKHVHLAPDARYALLTATAEAGQLRHEYVGTEHLLLGLLQDRPNQAVAVLNHLGVSPQSVRQEIEATVTKGADTPTPIEPTAQLPYTRRGMTAIEEAMREARRLDRGAVTAGDLLVGLLLEERGMAAQLLGAAGLKVEEVRAALRDAEPRT